MFTAKITGVKEIDKALKKLEPKVRKKMVRQAMRPALKPVQATAKEKCPVDTGALRDSIKVKAAKRSRRTMGVDVRSVGVPYYGPVEYGSKDRPPAGFMRNAYDTGKDKAKDDAINRIAELVEKEANKS